MEEMVDVEVHIGGESRGQNSRLAKRVSWQHMVTYRNGNSKQRRTCKDPQHHMQGHNHSLSFSLADVLLYNRIPKSLNLTTI